MQESVMMRVTQVLERSRLTETPLTITFKTRTVWYAFLYWLTQSFILACVYSGNMWFLPLFNLISVGWAWDKITSKMVQTDNDIEIGEAGGGRNKIPTAEDDVPKVYRTSSLSSNLSKSKQTKNKNPKENPLRTRARSYSFNSDKSTENCEASNFEGNLFGSMLMHSEEDYRNIGITSAATTSIVGENSNPVIDI